MLASFHSNKLLLITLSAGLLSRMAMISTFLFDGPKFISKKAADLTSSSDLDET